MFLYVLQLIFQLIILLCFGVFILYGLYFYQHVEIKSFMVYVFLFTTSLSYFRHALSVVSCTGFYFWKNYFWPPSPNTLLEEYNCFSKSAVRL